MMRLSDDKINYLSHVILKNLKEWDMVEFSVEDNDIRLLIKEGLIQGLGVIEELEAKVARTLQSYSRRIVEGSREWDAMFAKTFEEELHKIKPVKE